MTIGPAPMIRIDWMSVRLGIGSRKIGTKKERAAARPPDRAEVLPRARGRLRPDSTGREGKVRETMHRHGGYVHMSLVRQPFPTAKRSNVPAWIAGLALLATFAVTRVLERDQEHDQKHDHELAPALE